MPAPLDTSSAPICSLCWTPRFSSAGGGPRCRSCGHGVSFLRRCEALAQASVAPVDDYAAAEVLFELRWGRDWECRRCGHRGCTHLRSRPRLFECNSCGHTDSVTAGTTLHRCRVPLPLVVRAAGLLCRTASISARALSRQLDLTLETAWTLCHRLRAGFVDLPPIRLAGTVVLSALSFRARAGDGRSLPEGTIVDRHTRYCLLWDRSGRVAAVTGRPDHQGLRRFVDAHAAADRPIPGPFALWPDPTVIGNRTHHGVTDRWLGSYVHAIAGWFNARADGEDPALVTLRAALGSARFPFTRLRPRAPPDRLKGWRWNEDEYMVRFREWRLPGWVNDP